MGGCCEPAGYGDTFGDGFSRQLARRYRRRGLDRTATRMAGFLAGQGLDGASVLEVGGGVGALQLDLLRLGAERVTNLELVDSYEADAAALATEAGVTDRVTRRQLDLATSPDAVEPHDFVVLHRVVCCYPDYQRLLGAAAGRATRSLVFSHPPRSVLMRAGFTTENLVRRLRRNPFRSFLHDPAALTRAAEQTGLRATYRHEGIAWNVVGLTA